MPVGGTLNTNNKNVVSTVVQQKLRPLTDDKKSLQWSIRLLRSYFDDEPLLVTRFSWLFYVKTETKYQHRGNVLYTLLSSVTPFLIIKERSISLAENVSIFISKTGEMLQLKVNHEAMILNLQIQTGKIWMGPGLEHRTILLPGGRSTHLSLS